MWTSADMVARQAAGTSSAAELVAGALARAHAAQAAFNCFVLIDDPAVARAATLDAQREAGVPLGPLHGVPIAIKDLTPTAGHLTTLGSWSSGHHVPAKSALVVRRLEAAGAVVIGKTTTPEFAHASFTASPRWGITRNPRDPSRSPGGSSGGSGAAVAAGVVPLAEGTDMGGSVRIPAAFCGVVGLKPSLGRIPMDILPSVFDGISHFGPIGRTVDDAIRFLHAAAGPDEADPGSLPLAFDPARARRLGVSALRFALSVDLGHVAVHPAVAAAVREAAEVLRAEGATVDEVTLPWTRETSDRWTDLWAVFMSGFFGERLEAFRDRMDPVLVRLIEKGFALDATTVKRIEILRTRMWHDMAALLGRYDALLCPTCAIPPPLAEGSDDAYGANLPDGQLVALDMTSVFNMVPALPAISVPCGLAEGLPVGLQIVGRRHADEDVLAFAGSFERAFAG